MRISNVYNILLHEIRLDDRKSILGKFMSIQIDVHTNFVLKKIIFSP